jgi:hypothetical protein
VTCTGILPLLGQPLNVSTKNVSFEDNGSVRYVAPVSKGLVSSISAYQYNVPLPLADNNAPDPKQVEVPDVIGLSGLDIARTVAVTLVPLLFKFVSIAIELMILA